MKNQPAYNIARRAILRRIRCLDLTLSCAMRVKVKFKKTQNVSSARAVSGNCKKCLVPKKVDSQINKN